MESAIYPTNGPVYGRSVILYDTELDVLLQRARDTLVSLDGLVVEDDVKDIRTVYTCLGSQALIEFVDKNAGEK